MSNQAIKVSKGQFTTKARLILDTKNAERAAGRRRRRVKRLQPRQMSTRRTASSTVARPGLVEYVGGRIEVWTDDGIRSSQHVIKAAAPSARCVLISRLLLYGLRTTGEENVKLGLDITRKEMDITMALCGKRDIQDVEANILVKGKA